MNSLDVELSLIRRQRDRLPHLKSNRHAAAAVVAYLLFKVPGRHGVTSPLTAAQANELIGDIVALDESMEAVVLESAFNSSDSQPPRDGRFAEDELDGIMERLGQYGPPGHAAEWVDRLTRWFDIGDGCTLVSQEGVPVLVGTVPDHLERIWRRVPEEIRYGRLRYW
jgi:hypothetical protein